MAGPLRAGGRAGGREVGRGDRVQVADRRFSSWQNSAVARPGRKLAMGAQSPPGRGGHVCSMKAHYGNRVLAPGGWWGPAGGRGERRELERRETGFSLSGWMPCRRRAPIHAAVVVDERGSAKVSTDGAAAVAALAAGRGWGPRITVFGGRRSVARPGLAPNLGRGPAGPLAFGPLQNRTFLAR